MARFGTRFPGILLLATLVAPLPAQAQVTARLQGGLLAGQVRDIDSGQPVGYALVILADREVRVFASESGRFGVAGLPPGEYLLQVRQVGYAPATVRLRLVAEGTTPPPPPLTILLSRQALVLPEVSVSARGCEDPRRQVHPPEARAILDQAVTNGERLDAMEREFPLTARFERLTAGLTASDSALWFWWDTLSSLSSRNQNYRRGRVVETPRLAPVRINYFTPSDVARREFLENHCFWVAGEELLDSVRVVRVEFAPARRIRSADWTGALLLDAATGLLRQSEARLTSVPRNSGRLLGASCVVGYVEVAPTLVHEARADCRLELQGDREVARREVFRLLGWEFAGRSPGGP